MRNADPLLLLAAALSALGSGARAADATYVNARFGYSVRYPAELLAPEREADNGDGRAFHARRGSARLLVWASENALDQSPAELAAEAARSCGGRRPDYQVAKPKLVAVSCVSRSGAVFYQKSLLRGGVITSMQMTYPSAERSLWDRVVSAIAASLHAGAD